MLRSFYNSGDRQLDKFGTVRLTRRGQAAVRALNIAHLDFRAGAHTGLMGLGEAICKDLHNRLSTGARRGRWAIARSRSDIGFVGGRQFRRSAPGEMPARETGHLAESVIFQARDHRELIFGSTATSETGAPYPRFLEEGTQFMKPRPYLRPTAERWAGPGARDVGRHAFRRIVARAKDWAGL